MNAKSLTNSELSELLKLTKTIAVVGISDDPERPSFGVSQYMSRFFEIIPVNPKLTTWQGRAAYPSIVAIPKARSIDIVNIFRRSEDVPVIVDQAIMRGCRCVWMQQGIVNEAAAAKARAAGLLVVMDNCIAVVHRTLIAA